MQDSVSKSPGNHRGQVYVCNTQDRSCASEQVVWILDNFLVRTYIFMLLCFTHDNIRTYVYVPFAVHATVGLLLARKKWIGFESSHYAMHCISTKTPVFILDNIRYVHTHYYP